MLTLHSFLQSVVLFVKALAVKVKKEQYRTSSVVMAGAVVIAIVTLSLIHISNPTRIWLFML